MMAMKKLTTVLLLVLGSFAALAQDSTALEPTTKNYKHAFGFGAGFSTGVGFTYKYMPNKFGVQFRVLPFKDDYTAFVSSGITFRYKFLEAKKVNLFLYQGNHFIYEEDYSYYASFYPTSSTYTAIDVTCSYSTALGVGTEFLMGERFTSNVMLGYGAHNNFQVIAPSIETGIYFMF